MDAWLLLLGTLLVTCNTVMSDQPVETLEKYYTADLNYVVRSGVPHQHGPMGISTVAKFSMLSHTPTLFKVKRPGIEGGPNTVSFESIHKPGYYLRYKNYKFHMEQKQETSLFGKDATFREKEGPRGRAYELLGRDNWFMCHSDVNPYTLQAKSETIGTRSFVSNCVYVPVRQRLVNKKNIVRTTPTGGATVVHAVPRTLNTDKCINLRFVNKLGGPVRVVSSMKPEGYLVTANVFKLKTIFKHANHKQRHIIFYADNIQDRDDDVLLNSNNVFTTQPHQCQNHFQDVVLTSPTNTGGKAVEANTQENKVNSGLADLPHPPAEDTPKPLGMNDQTPKHPALDDETLKLPTVNEDTPKPPAINVDTPKPPAMNVDTPKPPATINDLPEPIKTTTEKPSSGLEANEIGLQSTTSATSMPSYYNTPKSLTNDDKLDISTPIKPTKNVAAKTHAATTANSGNPTKHAIQSLDDILKKRVQGVNAGTGYEEWSSYGACSVSCGVGYRRRTRVCKPGMYCSGPSTETRACITGQCASNCVHTSGGNVHAGSCCSFPFTYNGFQYDHCILSPTNNERLWCSTTPYYDHDKQWGFCPKHAKAETRSVPQREKALPTVHEQPQQPLQQTPQQRQQQPVQAIQQPVQQQAQQRQQQPIQQQQAQQPIQQPLQQQAQQRTQAQQPIQQQQYAAPSTMTTTYSSYYNNPAYNDRYRAYKDNLIPCNPMCAQTCVQQCPRHCCITTRSDLPLSAYYGNNYGPTDKRSSIYQPKHTRSLFVDDLEDEEYGEF